jgi:hypothetical protein
MRSDFSRLGIPATTPQLIGDTLHILTWSWPGEWTGKATVRESAEIWFEIKDSKLVPKKVELTEEDHETGRALVKHWP